MSRVLVTGSTGLLGVRLMESFSGGYDVVGACRKPAGDNSVPLDITDGKATVRTLADVSPDLVVHSAAVTDVDYCEEHKREAWKTNVEGTGNVVEGCRKAGCRLIYLSTDYVFDGGKGMYAEGDAVGPVNYYGLTKLEGEKIVQASGLDYVIARTSVLYGWYGGRLNYATHVIKFLRENRPLNMAADRFKSPTLTDNLADVIRCLYERNASGVYHTSGSERVSMYDFAVRVAKVFGLNAGLVKPQESKDFEQKAVRPVDSSLDVSKAGKTGLRLFNVTEGLEYMRAHE